VTILRSPSLMSDAFPTNHSAICHCSNEKVLKSYRSARPAATGAVKAGRMAAALI
jgi:hypothetical protein